MTGEKAKVLEVARRGVIRIESKEPNVRIQVDLCAHCFRSMALHPSGPCEESTDG